MNCPSCGTNNDVDARFCEACGTPLENQDSEATVIGILPGIDDNDNDMTILSNPGDFEAEAKTMRVDEAMLAAAAAEADKAAVSEPPTPPVSPTPPPTPSSPSPPSGGEPLDGGGFSGGDVPPQHIDTTTSGGNKNRMLIIIGVILLTLICCCCCPLVFGGGLGFSDPDAIEDLIRELSMLPVYLPLV